eukprot:CAMPEP_0177754868 /NCGR_PEP_ID=MMETSP0491_2-20121128/2245_1 /TAXON_ID=63592 /ORGANISM="Tetraselmis chuii, Strain PLY429" /LENGTH=57 /DNA_ID=CAMNT_0019270293 /DNA_START=84 /DNA_END=257 /DNA_ORIENTATION=-
MNPISQNPSGVSGGLYLCRWRESSCCNPNAALGFLFTACPHCGASAAQSCPQLASAW